MTLLHFRNMRVAVMHLDASLAKICAINCDGIQLASLAI